MLADGAIWTRYRRQHRRSLPRLGPLRRSRDAFRLLDAAQYRGHDQARACCWLTCCIEAWAGRPLAVPSAVTAVDTLPGRWPPRGRGRLLRLLTLIP